jgi:hypothetical protein
MCAEFLIIIIKLNSEVFKRQFEVIIIIKVRFEVLDCPCEHQICQILGHNKNVTIYTHLTMKSCLLFSMNMTCQKFQN